MENEILAHSSGKIRKIFVSLNDMVETDDPLFIIGRCLKIKEGAYHMDDFIRSLVELVRISGFAGLNLPNLIMLLVSLTLLYLAIVKNYEPLLLLPIAFGSILVNLPLSGLMEEGGFLNILSFGIHNELFPILIFMGIGAMTDFGPLLANPVTFLLGAAAQLGVFMAMIGAVLLGFDIREAASIGIVGGADGPTTIYLASKLAPNIIGAVAVAAYSYMSLVPRYSRQ